MTIHLNTLIDRATQKAMFANDYKRVGVNVSGGLDSSTVTCFAKMWNPHIRTFTGYYDVPGFDERRFAHMAAAGTEHYEILITAQHFVDNFDKAMEHFTPPYQGPGMFGQYMVAKYISDHGLADVVLSGEGSDELFGGYARLMAVAGEKLPDGYENYKIPADYPTTIEDALEYDYERLPDLLKVDDEALAAFGLVAAAPFTDPTIVSYALELDPSQRVGKKHLREAVRGIVPDAIIDRTDKMGMPIPLVQWANDASNPVHDFVGDRLGYIPDAGKPFDRAWWSDFCGKYDLPVAA